MVHEEGRAGKKPTESWVVLQQTGAASIGTGVGREDRGGPEVLSAPC